MEALPCSRTDLPHSRIFRPGWPIALARSLATLPILLAACHPAESPSLPHGRPGAVEAPAKAGSVLKARSLRIQDGDSFVARLADGSSRTIRLSGIDAPERHQPDGDAALQNLRRLLDNHDLQVRVAKDDNYGRAVAQVFVHEQGTPMDVGLAQVTEGMAWFYRQYRRDLPPEAVERYAQAEGAAKTQKRGLWRAPSPEPPWEFRRRQQPDGRASRH